MNIVASRGAGAQSVPVIRLVVGSIPTRGDEVFIYIYIFIASLWLGECAALSSTTQHAMGDRLLEAFKIFLILELN